MAAEVKRVELDEQAYRKLVWHASKYPASTVVGVLLGSIGSSTHVTDVIPLLHHWVQLSPMTEAGLAMIEAYLKEKNQKIVGVYEVPESLDSRELSSTTVLLAQKMAAKSAHPALALLVDGRKLLTPNLCAITAFVASQDNKATKLINASEISVKNYSKLVSLLDAEVNNGKWKALADWDDQLENPHLDFLTNDTLAP
ncbi:hypothetical protein MYAM1_001739 [Malassezia yamatoensis]|uniref:MPN domain-containing protein n=1 Tax=Malassezia yamatoensis TaxID=253288 RepID=A0AAJ5YRB6_9BASI|nr:hypothetical protein MYAM1_001739 [Malassezia yamatoensis]